MASSNWQTGNDARFGEFVRLEADSVAFVGTLPNPLIGGDLTISVGRPAVHLRLGAVVAAAKPYRLGAAGRIGTLLETTQLELCAASYLGPHRFRLCGGGQAGVMHLRWEGFEHRGAREMPWVALRGDGDYSLALGHYLDVHAGVGLVVPVVAPELVARGSAAVDQRRVGLVGTVLHAGIGIKLR